MVQVDISSGDESMNNVFAVNVLQPHEQLHEPRE